MKKFISFFSGLLLLGLTACDRESIPKPTADRTASASRTSSTPVPMDQAYWRVGSLTVSGSDLTPTYKHYVFHFTSKNEMRITHDFSRGVFLGTWTYSGSSFGMDVDENAAAMAPDDLSVFEGTWNVVSFTATTIELTQGSKHLRFDRI